MSRKLIRPPVERYKAEAPVPGRRLPPVVSNQAEVGYLRHAMESRGTLTVRLLGGGEVSGRIDHHDRDWIRLQCPGQPDLLLRREKIKYYWLERSDPSPQARSGT